MIDAVEALGDVDVDDPLAAARLGKRPVKRPISESDTLLPYLMETSTRTTTVMAVGGETQASSRTEEKRFVYTY